MWFWRGIESDEVGIVNEARRVVETKIEILSLHEVVCFDEFSLSFALVSRPTFELRTYEDHATRKKIGQRNCPRLRGPRRRCALVKDVRLSMCLSVVERNNGS